MEFSFLKALAASVRGQVSSLNSQSKRLHAASANVFGQAYPLDTCREAVAVANGYRNWREVSNLATVVGQDRSVPTWQIQYRSDLHEACIKAFVETDVHVSDLHPVVLLGANGSTAKPAVCLWSEQISWRKCPGVVVIDTTVATFQKTELGAAARELGLGEIFQRFRIIDAREPSIPLALTGTTRQWVEALQSAFTTAELEQLDGSKVLVHFELLLDMFGAFRTQGRGEDYDFYVVEQARAVLRTPSLINAHLASDDDSKGQGRHYLKHNFLDDSKRFDQDVLNKLFHLISELASRISGTGVLVSSESLRRPTVVLCDSADPISMVVSTLVSSMYFNRHPTLSGMLPILYWGAPGTQTLPSLLRFGSEAVIAVEGCDSRSPVWDSHSTRSPVFVTAEEGGIVVSGKWAATLPTQST